MEEASGVEPLSTESKSDALPLCYASIWSEWQDLNLRHRNPKLRALPTALHPVILHVCRNNLKLICWLKSHMFEPDKEPIFFVNKESAFKVIKLVNAIDTIAYMIFSTVYVFGFKVFHTEHHLVHYGLLLGTAKRNQGKKKMQKSQFSNNQHGKCEIISSNRQPSSKSVFRQYHEADGKAR